MTHVVLFGSMHMHIDKHGPKPSKPCFIATAGRSSRRAAVSVRAEASSSSGLDAIALGSFKVLVAGATGGVGRYLRHRACTA